MTLQRVSFYPPARVAGAVVELLGGGRAEIPEWLANDFEPSLGTSAVHGDFVAFRCACCGVAFAYRRGVRLKSAERLVLRNHALSHRVPT